MVSCHKSFFKILTLNIKYKNKNLTSLYVIVNFFIYIIDIPSIYTPFSPLK